MHHFLGLTAPKLREQRRAALLVLLAVGMAAALVQLGGGMLLLPALGASAVTLAALPSSPVSRPWPLFAGSLLSALLAWVISLQHWPLWLSAPAAVTLALLLMYQLRCLHPPGGAMVVWVLLHQPAFVSPVELLLACVPGLLVLAALAHLRDQMFAERAEVALPRHQTADPQPSERQVPSAGEWQRALRRHEQLLDVDAEQLEQLYRELEAERLRRRVGGHRVADIMSRDLVTLPPTASGQQAWRTLQHHKIKTLPVVAGQQVVGVIALVDLLKRMGLSTDTLPADLHELAGQVLKQPVQQLMSQPARTVPDSLSLDALVPLLSDWGLHHVPVVDAGGQLVGIVTQSDLIAALARQLGERAQATSSNPIPVTG